ncbi:PepSY domain-containing protein [Mesobacillus sp. AQ2]|jgi:predicted small secreted protein|uniref:PepSY domain-containing protein n=1 Tax=Bacillaceae TaxID=186817 RepID=UPI00119F9555|nr:MULTISPECIES: PepSY domain-containing protein [Bacillaceae]MCM3125563.1 PepSY domain-containing protein [Mesobacillus sp. MER 33]MCM3235647.1 PepSY domain-containing protein [Mesobacillus sp. MER 48]WHX39655.1 PepSY domain-containing protein [Mesobacillus sp. AQ2]
MNWKAFVLGVGAGLAGAYAVKELASQKETVSAEKVLNDAKAAFKKSGPISGSWINMTVEAFSKPPIEYQVYKGGVSRNVDGRVEQYEFIADAATGAILDAYPLN